MSAEVSHWLPQEALLGAAAKKVLREPIAAWSSHWFARGQAVLSKLSLVESGRGRGPEGPRSAIFLDMPGVGKRYLLEAALGVALGEHARNQYDGHILDVFAAEIADDLTARLDAELVGGYERGAAADLKAVVKIENNVVLDIFLPSAALVPKIKLLLGGTHRRQTRVHSRKTALRETRIIARGCLGLVELALKDIHDLGVGDVLVLDRSLNEPVELSLSENGRPIARGMLRTGDGKLSIQL